jgi:hypothetical protein
MTFEDFISRFEKKMKTARGFMVRCPAHEDGKSSLSVGRAKDGGVLLKCFAGCQPKDIVAALGLEMKDLFAEEKAKPFRVVFAAKPKVNGENGDVKPEIEKVYSYTDALGREVYQALRLKPKSFRQRHAVDGKWVWNMDGVERVLYRLPEVLKSDKVWIVEGEKDADNLIALGLCATCNVGGAGKWLDGYTESLKGKEIIICGDNDKPGQDHVNLVFESVSSRAKSVRIVKIPGVKDASDFLDSLPKEKPAKAVFDALAEDAVPHVGGVRMPVYSMADIEPRYHRLVTLPPGLRVDLAAWLPSFRNKVRPLTPGSVVLVQGDTGIGKTMILQNVAMSFPELKTLMFEMELPDEDLYERFWANKANIEATEIEKEYKTNGCFGEAQVMKQFPNLFICPESRLTLDQFEAILLKSELKMGGKPVLVLVDYAQLLLGSGNSRYERASSVAEGIKVIAKATQTIIFVASQVDRASAKEGDIGLHSAKDSGSLENSAGIVIGAHRDADDPGLLHLRVLKATKGGAGLTIRCNIDGAKSRITERSPVHEAAPEESAPRYPED